MKDSRGVNIRNSGNNTDEKSARKQADIFLTKINSESIPLEVVLNATVMMIDNLLSDEKLRDERSCRDLISKHIMKLYDLEDEFDVLVAARAERNRSEFYQPG